MGTTRLFGLCTLPVSKSRSIGLQEQEGARRVTYVCIVLVKDRLTQHLVIVLRFACKGGGVGVEYHSINNVVGEM